ncbi:MAG: chemotaxis protein CheW [Alphaproteobacteria bacterium]|nr:chemotaxis protein CheW [Alphaproteobacteria bacterium SS10]
MAVTDRNGSSGNAQGEAELWDYVTMRIAGQLFGIPVLQVQDVLGPQRITKIPLAPSEVAGSLNLRGRIVTAIDVRLRLDLESRSQNLKEMSIVVEHEHELYSLIVDEVGEVLNLEESTFEKNPATMDRRWRDVSSGIHRLDGELLVILDIGRLLSFADLTAA